MKIFVDTNVFIDFIGNRAEFIEDAKKLCAAAFFGDVKLWVSTQTITDADYIFRKASVREQARQKMAASLKVFHVCGTHALDVEQALTSGWPDVEDYVIAQSALRVGADALATRDMAGFKNCSVAVYSPKEILDELRARDFEYDEVIL